MGASYIPIKPVELGAELRAELGAEPKAELKSKQNAELGVESGGHLNLHTILLIIYAQLLLEYTHSFT